MPGPTRRTSHPCMAGSTSGCCRLPPALQSKDAFWTSSDFAADNPVRKQSLQLKRIWQRVLRQAVEAQQARVHRCDHTERVPDGAASDCE